MKTYTVSPPAQRDLQEIHDYIAKDNPSAAARFIEGIEQRCQLLADFPDIGERRDDLLPALRCFSFGRYLVLYRAGEAGVEIVHVIHGARDVEALPNPPE